MKSCICIIETTEGTDVKVCRLQGNQSFGLEEMEKWQREAYEGEGKEVVSVKCKANKYLK